MARDTYTQSHTARSSSTFHTYATTQSSQSGSIYADTVAVPRAPQRKISSVADRGQGVAGRGQGAIGRGKGSSGRDGGSGRSQYGADRGCGSGRGQCGADRGNEGGTSRGQGGSGGGLKKK
ncbi:probable H/ACA ribonucleoprotein complex subunit 1 [Capsicum annuum]|uniref:probable H/ACA ribonucleoprotein complex subunit 1 n=1 Tax=Capsicum annuum TaxID=4072 RepID=UPI0007BF732F|nr:probable H/ACA ribonucleoprotein complex subunit 1 [Capsicum annuum]